MIFSDITSGTTVNYSDICNDTDFLVLDAITDKWGTKINLLSLADGQQKTVTAHTKIAAEPTHGINWTVIS